MKHRVALNVHMQRLEEKKSAQTQDKDTLPEQSVLLPLPEIPPTLPIGPNNGSSDIFGNFRCLGLAYLDENREQLEFSAGTVLDDGKGHQTWSEETETATSECSDSESEQSEWAMQDSGSGDYWPYPLRTVSDKLRA